MSGGAEDYPPKWAIFIDKEGRKTYGPVRTKVRRKTSRWWLVVHGGLWLTLGVLVLIKNGVLHL